MFGRRKQPDAQPPTPEAQPPALDRAPVYDDLRAQILRTDPAEVGLDPDGRFEAWGFLMETGYPRAIGSVVCVRDGTTSLYTTSGFGIIGGGGHASVREANARLFAELDRHLELLTPTTDTSLPTEGETVLLALTHHGVRRHANLQREFGERRDPCSGVFHAGENVLTQLRLIHEAAEKASGA